MDGTQVKFTSPADLEFYSNKYDVQIRAKQRHFRHTEAERIHQDYISTKRHIKDYLTGRKKAIPNGNMGLHKEINSPERRIFSLTI